MGFSALAFIQDKSRNHLDAKQQLSQGGWEGGATTQMQIKKNTLLLALLRQPFALEWTTKLFKASLKHTFRGANLSKTKFKNQ